jgi:hypothetical protein
MAVSFINLKLGKVAFVLKTNHCAVAFISAPSSLACDDHCVPLSSPRHLQLHALMRGIDEATSLSFEKACLWPWKNATTTLNSSTSCRLC